MTEKKPIWKKFKFWLPLVTGLVGALTVLAETALGIEVSADVQAWIIGAVLTLIGAFLGLDWSEKEV